MDKIKLFSNDTKIIAQSVINNQFLHTSSRTDSRGQRHRITYTCEYPVAVSIDGYGTYIEFNPTSLARGNNLVQIEIQELLTAIEAVEDMLNVNLRDWKLTGLDFNQDLVTDHEPSGYLPIFRTMAAFTKMLSPGGSSLTFFNDCRCMRLYDKLKQALDNGVVFDPSLFPEHLLRIELSIKQRLQRLRGFQDLICVRQLLEQDNYVLVVNEWERMYGKIAKQSIQRFRTLVRPLSMDLRTFSEVSLINSRGMQTVLDALDSDVKQGRLNYQTARRRKQKFRSTWEHYLASQSNHHDLLLELDRKVHSAAEKCRQTS